MYAAGFFEELHSPSSSSSSSSAAASRSSSVRQTRAMAFPEAEMVDVVSQDASSPPQILPSSLEAISTEADTSPQAPPSNGPSTDSTVSSDVSSDKPPPLAASSPELRLPSTSPAMNSAERGEGVSAVSSVSNHKSSVSSSETVLPSSEPVDVAEFQEDASRVKRSRVAEYFLSETVERPIDQSLGFPTGKTITLDEIQRDRLTRIATENWSITLKDEEKPPFDASLVDQIYRTELLITVGTKPVPLQRVMLLEISQYLENYLWPNFDPDTSTFEHLMSIILMVNEKVRFCLCYMHVKSHGYCCQICICL